MHRINTNIAWIVFLDKLTKASHLYPTRFSQLNYAKQLINSIDQNTEFQ